MLYIIFLYILQYLPFKSKQKDKISKVKYFKVNIYIYMPFLIISFMSINLFSSLNLLA